MTIKTLRCIINKKKVQFLETHFQMEDVATFNVCRYDSKYIEVYFYNTNRQIISHDYTDFCIRYEQTRPKDFLNLN